MNPSYSRRQLLRSVWLGIRSERATGRRLGTESYADAPIDMGADPPHPGELYGLKDLPPVYQAALSPQEVGMLLRDIEHLATNLQVMGFDLTADEPKHKTLLRLRDQLVSGALRRVQFRYGWNGQLWIDTLVHAGHRFSLTRIGHQQNTG